MSNTNFYQRISGSSIQGNANVAIEPYNTLVITNNNELRLHDGNTAGGNLIAGGGSFATTSSLVNGNYTVSLSSSTGVLTLSTASTILGSGTDPNVYIETSTTTTNSIWTFGTNGELTLPSDTPVIKGAGTGTDVTILAQSTSSTSTWVFGADGSITLPTGSVFDSNNNYVTGSMLKLNNTDNDSDFIITTPDGIVGHRPGKSILIQGSIGYGADGNYDSVPGGKVTIAGGYTLGGTGGKITVFGGGGEGSPSPNGGNIDISAGYDLGSVDGPADNLNPSYGGYYKGGQILLNTRRYGSTSTSTWVFDVYGTLTVPGAITSVNGVAAVLYASSGTAAIVSNYSGFNQLFVQDDGVYIQSSANNSGTTFTNWTFGTDGTTHFPGSVILAPTSQSITMQSDQYSQLMWMNADQTTGTNKMTNSDFYVESGNATLDIGYFDGAGVQKYTTWLWNADGALTFPQGGTLRVSAVPAHSYGAVGDKAGTLAFDGSYIYYCTADFSGSTQYPARTAIGDANGVNNGYLVPDSFQLPSIGWIVYYNNQTATINEVNNGGNPGYYTIFTDTPLFIPVNSDFYYGPAPTDNIWVKQAWGTTGSW